MNHTATLDSAHCPPRARRHRPTFKFAQHAPELQRYLHHQGIEHVRAEYDGFEGQGRFIALTVTYLSGTTSPLVDSVRTPGMKALFLALLISRYPDWREGYGAFGDFRWNVQTDQLQHTHYLRGPHPERVTHHGA